MKHIIALVLGTLFGLILVKAEVLSWFRIQEMFAFQSFHMYGIIGSAVGVGALSVWLIRTFKVKSVEGNVIELKDKAPRYVSATGRLGVWARLGHDGRVPRPDVRLDWQRDHHHGACRRGRGVGCPNLRRATRQTPPLRVLPSPGSMCPQRTTRRRVTPVASFWIK